MEVLTQNISRAGRNLTDTQLLRQLTEAEDLRAGLQLPQHPAEKPFLGFNTLCLGKLPQATEEPSLLCSPAPKDGPARQRGSRCVPHGAQSARLTDSARLTTRPLPRLGDGCCGSR